MTIETRIVGVTHPNHDGTSRQEYLRGCSRGEMLRLVPEPDNSFDVNAVKVETESGYQVGYLPRDVAENLMRNGPPPTYAKIKYLMGGRPDRPTMGAMITIWPRRTA